MNDSAYRNSTGKRKRNNNNANASANSTHKRHRSASNGNSATPSSLPPYPPIRRHVHPYPLTSSPPISSAVGRGYFSNARPAYWRSRGYVLYPDELKTGETGLYVEEDGPVIKVIVTEGPHVEDDTHVYRFSGRDGVSFTALVNDQGGYWNLYKPIRNVGGGRRSFRKHKRR